MCVLSFAISGLLTLSSGATSSGANPSPIVDRYTYWYHPVGSACPVYYFDPNDTESKTLARSWCEQENRKSCTWVRGTASPAC
jgi:hypothetical protein